MTLLARLAALEARHPAIEALRPFAVLLLVCDDGTSVSVCYPLPHARTDTMTLREYRQRFGETYRSREQWVILNDAEPSEDRLCDHPLGRRGTAG